MRSHFKWEELTLEFTLELNVRASLDNFVTYIDFDGKY